MDSRLIERGGLGHVLTESGQILLSEAEAMEAAAAGIERRVAGSDSRLSGDLRVASVDMMVDRLLAPLLLRFAEAHPAVSLRLITALSAADLVRREADVAIRVSRAPSETLVGRRLCDFALAAYAAPAFLARQNDSLAPAGIDWIGWEDPKQEARLVMQAYPDARIRHRADGFLALNALVKAGLGASVLPCYWADADPGLLRLYPDSAPIGGHGLWLLAHPDLRNSARVRAFLQMATSALLAERAAFKGEAPGSGPLRAALL